MIIVPSTVHASGPPELHDVYCSSQVLLTVIRKQEPGPDKYFNQNSNTLSGTVS